MPNPFQYPVFTARHPTTNVPLAGGKVYFYDAGTTDLKDTYSDSVLQTANTNPVILDANGEADIYLSGSYKVKLTQSDNTQVWVYDNITAIEELSEWTILGAATYVSATSFTVSGDQTAVLHPGRRVKLADSSTLYGTISTSVYGILTTVTVTLDSGSITNSLTSCSYGIISADNTSIGFLPSGTGAIGRSLDNKLSDFLSVKDFGVTGDGVTDDTTALQVALDAAIDLKKPLYVPSGTYIVSSTLNWIRTGDDFPPLILIGDGVESTIFTNKVSGGAMLFINGGQSGTDFIRGSKLEAFSIKGDGAATTSDGIYLSGCWQTQMMRVSINSLSGTAVSIGGLTGQNPDNTATANTLISNCNLDSNAKGLVSEVNNNTPNLSILESSIRNNSLSGIEYNSSYLTVRDSSVSFNGLSNQASAVGGITIEQQDGANYRCKGLLIERTELDSNYPHQVKITAAELPVLKACSIQMSDQYVTLTSGMPPSQIILGGTATDERVWGPVVKDCRLSVNNTTPVAWNSHVFFKLFDGCVGAKLEHFMFNFSDSGTGLGTNYFYISEDAKAGGNHSAYDSRKYYVDYDQPILSYPTGSLNDTAIAVQYPKSFARNNFTLNHGSAVDDDTAIIIPTPDNETNGGNYGSIVITIAGNAAYSGIIGYRGESSPACYIIAGAASITVTTGVLTGTTGVDTELTVSAHSDGNLYIENRLGSTQNVQVTFLMSTGFYDQITYD